MPAWQGLAALTGLRLVASCLERRLYHLFACLATLSIFGELRFTEGLRDEETEWRRKQFPRRLGIADNNAHERRFACVLMDFGAQVKLYVDECV